METGNKKRILAIDDAPDILNTIKMLLEDSYVVYTVSTPQGALQILDKLEVDLILLDIEMPDMDGFILLKTIRKMEKYAGVPVIFVTGNANVNNIMEAVNSGGIDFIRKPLNAALLRERIEKQLGLVAPFDQNSGAVPEGPASF
jgi:DNA-binding response OmpR family regulator